jgi:splicing factor, arginine/serine-rich 7
VADIGQSVTQSELEKAFRKFGEIEEVWMAKNPPCFSFIVFKNRDDADEAIREMNGR